MYSIEKRNTKDTSFLKQKLQESKGIGIAYPIYGSDAPNIVKEFLNTMIEAQRDKFTNQNKHQFGYVITSMALWSGDGALALADKMKELGLELKYATNIKMTSNISVPGFHLDPVPETEYDKRKTKAIEKIQQFIEDMLEESPHLEGKINPISKIGGWGQRTVKDHTPLLDILLSFTVDHEKCNKCLTCIKYCPTENISIEEGEIKFGNKCTYCMRCYNFCPTSAIHTEKRTCDPEEYKRFKGPSEDFHLDKIAHTKNPKNTENQN